MIMDKHSLKNPGDDKRSLKRQVQYIRTFFVVTDNMSVGYENIVSGVEKQVYQHWDSNISVSTRQNHHTSCRLLSW